MPLHAALKAALLRRELHAGDFAGGVENGGFQIGIPHHRVFVDEFQRGDAFIVETPEGHAQEDAVNEQLTGNAACLLYTSDAADE